MVQSRVDEDPRIIPCTGLDPNSLVDEGVLREVLVGNRNSCTKHYHSVLPMLELVRELTVFAK